MGNITKRQKDIIKYLMKDSPISSEYLSKVMGLSSKTIRKEIHFVSQFLCHNGADIYSKRGSGFTFQITNNKLFENFKKEYLDCSKAEQPEANLQRSHYIIRRLLSSNDYVKIEDLAQNLYISRTTITSDMRYAKKVLKTYDIQVLQKPNYGLIISGAEHNIRLCLVDEYDFYSSDDMFACETDYERFVNINENLRNEIERLLFDTESKFSAVNFPDRIVSKVIRLIVLISRRQGYTMEGSYSDSTIYEIRMHTTYSAAKYIAKMCEPLLNYSFNREDCVLLTLYLIGMRDFTNVKNVKKLRRFYDFCNLSEDVIDEICDINGFNMMYRDMTLQESLALHLMSMEVRVKYNIKLDSTLKMSIKQNLGLGIEIAVQCAEILKRKWNKQINENEILFLALIFTPMFGRYNVEQHKRNIIIVSSISKSIAKTVEDRFWRNFGCYINSISIMDSHEINTINEQNFDFIFTDLSSSYFSKCSLPIIHFNSFFVENEKLYLRYVLSLGADKLDRILKIFNKHLYFTNVKAKNQNEVLFNIYTSISQYINLPEKFYIDIKRRNQLSSIEIGKNVAILKPLHTHINKSFIAVFILEHPIMWDTEYVKLIIVWHHNKEDNDDCELFESGFTGRIMKFIFALGDRTVPLLQNPDYDSFISELKKYYEENMFK